MHGPPHLDNLRLGDLPDRAAKRWGARSAVHVIEPDGAVRSETYREFAANVDRTARGLMAVGVAAGDHVAVWMTNRPEWLHLMYAVSKVGACLVPLNTRYRSRDMAFTVTNAECTHLVMIDQSGPIDYRSLIAETRAEIEEAGYLRTIVMKGAQLNGTTSWADMLAAADTVTPGQLQQRADDVDPDALMMLAYTSGTTGLPKGVMHSHRPILNIRERAIVLGHTRNDTHLNYLPLFHIYSLSEIAITAILTGGAQVLFENFDGGATLDAVERFGGTVLHGFESHWNDQLAAQEATPRELSTLRVGTLPAGMQSTVPIARRSQELCPTVSGFGMSESWSFICVSHPLDTLEQRTEASGFPMDGVEIEIRDPESGAVLRDGSAGQFFIRNFTVTSGYWANPTATADTIDAEGWLDTGDMATMRPDGHVVFMGRYKDMLKVGGENMSPAEVEGYLLEVAGVSEAAVVALPDDRLGEVPVAYVVRSKHTSDELVTEEELIGPLHGRIASYKIPRALLFIDEMPMTPSGKIRKIELRARAITDLSNG